MDLQINKKAFESACNDGNLKRVQGMLGSGDIVNVNFVNEYGSTPLILACLKGHTDIVKVLLDNYADFNVQGPKDWSPLHCATFYGHIETANLLLIHGSRIDVENSHGYVPGSAFNKGVPSDKCAQIKRLLTSYETKNSRFEDPEEFQGNKISCSVFEIVFEKLTCRTRTN
mmetsp:Transcript_12839/g.16545  ORF Transcript_12839/g.16545 Transcript_12839/m.16545 type:complete len:171 (-) Transcript_12839:361-873(-)